MRNGGHGTLVARPRVLALMCDASVVLLEAPGGFGKSTAVRQLAAALDLPLLRAVLPDGASEPEILGALAQAARRAGIPPIAEALDPDDASGSLVRIAARPASFEGVVIAVDEVQRATPEGAAWLARLAQALPPSTRLVLAGRRLDATLVALADRIDATHLGPEALRMDADEVAAVIAEGTPRSGAGGTAADEAAMARSERVTAVSAATDGWPAAVGLAAMVEGHGERQGASANVVDGPRRVLRTLVDELLAAATIADRDTIARLGALPLLSAGVAATVGGPGTLERLLDLGLPVRFRPDGWGELPDPVRELLPAAVIDPMVARAVADLYAQRDALGEGAALLRRCGDPEGVARLLAAAGREALLAAGLLSVSALAWDLPDAVLAAVPGLLVRLFQAAERRPRVRADWAERAARLVADPSPERRAIDTERALDLARGGDLEAGAAMVSAIIEATGPGEIATLGRARYIRGLLRLVADPATGSGPAAAEVEPAVSLLRAAGERAWEADAWQVLGLGCHGAAGRLDLAIECLERALALRSARDGVRATSLTYLAEVLTHAGRLDDAAVAVREAEAIGRRLGDPRAIGYAAWSGARLAAERRDLGGVHAALAAAEANPDGWLDELAGIDFLADGADMLAVCGDGDGARAWIERAAARGREVGREGAPLLALARLAASGGDAEPALDLIEQLEGSALAVPRDRWLAWLLRAVCHRRLDRGAEADRWLAQARRWVADQGDPGRLERREPELLAMASGSTAVPEERPAPDLVVVLLGRFAVERGGVDVTPPPGRPATLVKLLALRGVLPLDEAVEVLWDDADEEVGRARLRNVLNRIRGASGDVVVRREEALALVPEVTVDALRFEVEAGAALRATAAARVGLARAALARATGELLPADRYADWASAPRERLMRRHLALLDLVADDAIGRGDLDEAGRLLDEAIALDPLEEERHVRLGRALLRQGRSAAARRVADRALALCAELDVEPGDELGRLLGELARQA